MTAISLPDIADRHAASQAAKVAFRFLERGEEETGSLTFGQLAARARALAAGIARLARPGERALLVFPAGLDFPVAFLACLYAGVIPVAADVPSRRSGPDRLAAIARTSGSRLFLTDCVTRTLLPDLGAPWVVSADLEAAAARGFELPPVTTEAIAYLQYTSGSTQTPRGVAISQRALMQQLDLYQARSGAIGGELVFVSWLPHTHDFGLVGFILSAIFMGTTSITMPPSAFLRRPARWLEAISTHRGSYCGAPNIGYELCAEAGARTLAHPIDLSSWRIASLGGDHISHQTLTRFNAEFAPFGFRDTTWLPAYGLAEAVLCATGRRGAVVKSFDAAALRTKTATPAATAEPPLRLVSCGSSMPGQSVRIVDPAARVALAEGAVGEIWLTGASLATGYWNDEAATEAQFAARLADDDGSAYLRTGDCGFVLGDELFVTGRLKDVIIVHGRNHGPDDIEETIQSVHPALRAGAGIVVQADATRGGRLIAIQEVVRGDDTDMSSLLTAISAAVAQRHGLALDVIDLIRRNSLPRTRNGKLSRQSCLAAFETGDLAIVASWRRPPTAGPATTATEARLLAELRQMLRVETLAPDQNLFELGLDSLAVLTLSGRLDRDFGVDLAVETIFETPTVAGLAAAIDAHRAAIPLVTPTIDPNAATAEVSLASMQQELHRLTALVTAQGELIRRLIAGAPQSLPDRTAVPKPIPDHHLRPTTFALNETQREIKLLPELRANADTVFNIVMVLQHDGPFDTDAVRSALTLIASRHEALRTVFEGNKQRVLEDAAPALAAISIDGDHALGDWLRAERRLAFALDQVPPWRVTLISHGAANYLVLTAHHLVLDGASLPIFVTELAAQLAGTEANLPAPTQLRDVAAVTEARRREPGSEAHKAYWHATLGTHLSDFVPPGDRRPSRAVAYDAAVYTLTLDGRTRDDLIRCGAAAKATLFHTLLAAYAVLLHRVSAQERITIGLDVANRVDLADAALIGCTNAIVPIVTEFPDRLSARTALADIRAQVLAALAHRDYTMTMWAQDARIAFDLSRPFKITAAMNMQRFPARAGPFVPRFDLESQSISQSPFGLVLDVRDGSDALRLDFVYNTQLFDAGQIGRYAGYFQTILAAMARDPSIDLLALPILPVAEANELLALGRAATTPLPYHSFLNRFKAQVDATPDAEAVVCDGMRLSYRALQLRASQIAAAIRDRVPPGGVVALLSTRGSTYLAALIGILEAGCIYLPIDPKDPDARIAGQLSQADVCLLMHDRTHAPIARGLHRRAGTTVQVLDFETLPDAPADAIDPPAITDSTGEAPAYLLFTSGTTGLPKAAVVTHAGMINHLNAKIDLLTLSSSDTLAQTAPQSFDISVWQYLAPLVVGGRVRVIGDSLTHDPRALFAATERHAITVLELVPSVLRPAIDILLEPDMRCPLKALRWLISTGEALPADVCRRWISIYPSIPIMNAYGPTECSDDVTHHIAEWPPGPGVVRVPIGRPIPGADLLILDKAGNLAPTGTSGELYIGGLCVGLGYHNDRDRTEAAFVPDRFAQIPGGRLYRTGDLVRFLDDGALDYLGRLDRQVKINGVRIEPREIEAAIQRDPAVQQSLVTARRGADGKERLIAYVVFRNGLSSPEGALKAAARKVLPPSLIPSRFIVLDAMPLSVNGKIDAQRLPEPDLQPRPVAATTTANPVETILLTIWSETLSTPVRFGLDDDFFELGGSSLEATMIAKRVEDRFDIRLPVSAIFRAPTIAGLATAVATLTAQQQGQSPTSKGA